MTDPKTCLLLPLIRAAAETQSDMAWAELVGARAAVGDTDPDLGAAMAARDAAVLRAMLDEFAAGKRPLPEQDKSVFKRAMKAFRKRLKLTRLDAESSLGGGPMSSGRGSGIVGVQPPVQYPQAIWDELVRMGRLVDNEDGTFELPVDQQVE